MPVVPLRLAPILAALLLSACAQTSSPSPQAAASAEIDDEAYCRSNGGPVGSNGFAACLKERDIARTRHDAGMDRAHQRAVESLLKP